MSPQELAKRFGSPVLMKDVPIDGKFAFEGKVYRHLSQGVFAPADRAGSFLEMNAMQVSHGTGFGSYRCIATNQHVGVRKRRRHK